MAVGVGTSLQPRMQAIASGRAGAHPHLASACCSARPTVRDRTCRDEASWELMAQLGSPGRPSSPPERRGAGCDLIRTKKDRLVDEGASVAPFVPHIARNTIAPSLA